MLTIPLVLRTVPGCEVLDQDIDTQCAIERTPVQRFEVINLRVSQK